MSFQLTHEQAFLVRAWQLSDATLEDLKISNVMYFGGQRLLYPDSAHALAEHDARHAIIERAELERLQANEKLFHQLASLARDLVDELNAVTVARGNALVPVAETFLAKLGTHTAMRKSCELFEVPEEELKS